MKRKVKITDTTLRDGHQSLWATRMRTEHMLPILEKLDRVGYHSLEVWGGATFDVCLRYLKEDPWERLRAIKKIVKNTPLQMLLRGQSLVGYQHYPDDVVERFVFKAVDNGIDIIRIFDALNDIRNMEVPMKAAKASGAHVQAAVVYTISPVHTLEHYLETAKRLVEMGADSICIKDMAGLCTPYHAYELVAVLKKEVGVPLQFHSHYIGGLAVGAYLKAIEAGVDVVDTASVPLAFGASQPPVETVVRALADTPYDTELNIHELFEIARYFEDLRKRLGYERGVTRISDMRVFEHQVPGGMITNLISQLEEQKALHRLEEVLEEIPRVRAELGYPPLVTPTSQIVGTQAVLNVLTGQRYKLIPGEVRSYVQGLYGRPPAPIDPDIQALILGDLKPVECRPADLLEPKMEKIKEEIKNLARSEEDLLSYALFPQIARKFFEEREQGKLTPVVNNNEGTNKLDKELRKEEQNLNLKEIRDLILLLNETNIAELIIESEGTKIAIKKGQTLTDGITPAPVVMPENKVVPEKAEEKSMENFSVITSPMVGTFYRAPAPGAPPFVEVGQRVKPGDVLCIIEAMKLMNEIESEIAGEIVEILVENGEAVEYGQPLFKVRV
ncbi:acetyl-CoA carboxylase biotin carboxyl carrier protein [Carboxydothermus pertinax]|uniref:Pyruvate carboxylase subunit B n=1 Tax=Carboxydothermus pertinax TaxID=870242 RepID=A0A1L8CTY9_9THEO|nr:acetyl-CoA carboxylase biotin carboxyl carrier protein [Carboxydothermus pertinax]GAV22371.1 pyruvate carboxylase subunit B [Carboxydothermus pertinax]